MEYQPIRFSEKLSLFSDHWAPRIVAQMNNYHFKLAKIEGEFVWHAHPETDEVFIVLKGSMRIEFRDGQVQLQEGEMFVVPRATPHRPVATTECHILLVEPAGTANTGDAGGERTAPADLWI